jgi:hypothetical protein
MTTYPNVLDETVKDGCIMQWVRGGTIYKLKDVDGNPLKIGAMVRCSVISSKGNSSFTGKAKAYNFCDELIVSTPIGDRAVRMMSKGADIVSENREVSRWVGNSPVKYYSEIKLTQTA